MLHQKIEQFCLIFFSFIPIFHIIFRQFRCQGKFSQAWQADMRFPGNGCRRFHRDYNKRGRIGFTAIAYFRCKYNMSVLC